MDFKWSARDGYYQYPTSGDSYYWDTNGNYHPGTYAPWSADETKTPIYGTGIIYETAYLGAAIGLRARYALPGGFSIDASFAFTPLLSCYAEDNHVLRQVDFYSTLSGGFMVEPRVAVEWAPFAGRHPAARGRLQVHMGPQGQHHPGQHRYHRYLDALSVHRGT